MAGPYTPGEVLWLLQMDREQAVDVDAYPHDSLMDLSEDPQGGGSANADTELFTIARWWDVQRARDRVIAGKRAAYMEVVYERLVGLTEQEVAARHGIHQSTVNRRFRAKLRELIEALGGSASLNGHGPSRVSACMNCASRPRARVAALPKRKGVEDTRPERERREHQISLCAECAPEELRARVV